MLKILKYLLVILILHCTFYIIHSDIFASEFDSFYKTTYEFSLNGDTNVTQEISLVNQTSNLYASEYTLSLSSGEISNLQAHDKIGPITTKITKKDNSTIITLAFNDKVVGQGKILAFVLKYKIKGLAKKTGNIWDIAIPKLILSEEINNYETILKVPLAFGKVSSINPAPKSQEIKDNFRFLSYKKEDLAKFGVLASFGQYQLYDFSVRYDLTNENDFKIEEKIALPPDTDYQTVSYKEITPRPNNIIIDEDGNWLASFSLPPSQKTTIVATGQVKIFSEPKPNKEKITLGEKYLADSKYWQTENSEIKKLADQLKTAKNIYNYIVKKLTYDYELVKIQSPRKGAVEALSSPTHAVCSEFTDLFIAIARAAGIPAREVVGYAQTNNPFLSSGSSDTELFHSWPQYFDFEKNAWIAVDPTWEKTSDGIGYFDKFDTAHFAMVIHGLSDILPFSIGYYKEKESSKQLEINPTETEIKAENSGFSVSRVLPSSIYSRTTPIRLFLKNNDGEALSLENFSISSSCDVDTQNRLTEIIPPFGEKEFDFTIKPKELFKDYTCLFSIKDKQTEVSINLKIKSFFVRIAFVVCVLLSFCSFGLFFLIRKSTKKHLFSDN